MLVIEGFVENGVFFPNKPLAHINGRQKAVLTIAEDEEKERQEQINAWREFSRAIRSSGEILEGEPEKIRFKTPDEIDAI